MEEYLPIMVYVVTGLYGFLIIFLFAFVINIFQKVKNIEESGDNTKSDISHSRNRPPGFPLPKPTITKNSHLYDESPPPELNQPEQNQPERHLPERYPPELNQIQRERHLPERYPSELNQIQPERHLPARYPPELNQPERNEPERHQPKRHHPERSHFRNDFNGIDFNNRMVNDKPFKPSASTAPQPQGGSYSNSLFDEGTTDLENKYDYTDPRDQGRKPYVPGFRIRTGLNQPSNLYPKREFPNNNFRY